MFIDLGGHFLHYCYYYTLFNFSYFALYYLREIFSPHRQGSVIADVTLLYEALDGQQLIVLQEDLDQDGLLNQDMPVVYTRSEIVTTEGRFM